VYELIGLLLDRFDELAVDLLLVVIRTIGPQLRADDPAALKQIVLKVFDTAKKGTFSPYSFLNGIS